jgi:melatonin receptor type 1B
MPADPEHTKLLAYQLAHRSLAQVIAETATLVFIALAALVGNSSVLYVVYKSPRLRSVTNYYLITLAISDVTFAALVMTVTIGTAACGRDVIGINAAQVIGFIGYALVSGSLQTTTLIAINRFFCVVKPLLYRKYFKPKPAVLMIIGVWVVSLANTAVVYLSGMATFEFYPGRFVHLLAFTDQNTERIYQAISCVVFVVIPISITVLCYWKVYQVVTVHNATVSSNLHAGPAENTSSLSKEEIHVTKSVLALVCGFVLCWIPCTVVSFLASFMNLPRNAEMVFIYNAYTSSVINPIVFNIFNKPFRNQFAKVFGFKAGRVGASSEQPVSSLTDRA